MTSDVVTFSSGGAAARRAWRGREGTAGGRELLRFGAVLLAGGLLFRQHRLVAPDRLDAVDAAFFTTNGVLSVVMCVLFVCARIFGG